MITNGSGPRYAWYGRVSTEDEQDPTLSFPRQLANAERQVAETGGRIVAHYFDVESGTGAYGARGSGSIAGFQISISRDGGLRELLADAARRPARFDRVIVESISRLSRNSAVAFRIDDELRAAGVRLCAADEPAEESFGSIVLRHVNIGIARGYHHELMVKSRQGQEVSTRQGWHTGGAVLYGYRFVEHDHPNPHKAHRGQRKHTLELDPVRAPVVRAIYDWYLAGGVGLTQIRDRLNADPARFPPPTPVDPARALGAWSRSSVWEVLNNPKYTGHQVWNRRARKKGSNRLNPPETWIWSDQPAHPAIVSRAEHDAVAARAAGNARSRQGGTATAARPAAKHDYLYRGLLRCGICGLRMWGNHRRSSTYYSCQPSHQRAKQIPDGHPAHVYLNEAKLSAALLPFLGTALFGPERQSYWRACLDADAGEQNADGSPPARQRDLEGQLADLERRLHRQLLNLEADDLTPALRRRVAARIDELETAIAERRSQLTALRDHAAQQADSAPTFANVAPLLDQLPILVDRLPEAPQPELRALLESLQLDVTYQPTDHALDVTITLYDAGEKASEDWTVHLREVLSSQPAPLEKLLRRQAKYTKRGGNRLDRRAVIAQTGVPSEEADRVRLTLRQPNHKLQPDEIDELVQRYLAGESMRSLAGAFNLYDKTVRAHLLRRGVQLRQTNVAKRYRPSEP